MNTNTKNDLVRMFKKHHRNRFFLERNKRRVRVLTQQIRKMFMKKAKNIYLPSEIKVYEDRQEKTLLL